MEDKIGNAASVLADEKMCQTLNLISSIEIEQSWVGMVEKIKNIGGNGKRISVGGNGKKTARA